MIACILVHRGLIGLSPHQHIQLSNLQQQWAFVLQVFKHGHESATGRTSSIGQHNLCVCPSIVTLDSRLCWLTLPYCRFCAYAPIV